MINAKKEFLNLVKKGEVKCANIKYEPSVGYWPDEDSNLDSNQSKQILLKIGYSESDYQVFLDSLDFEYENGFGIQQLFGFVWFKDGTWMERWEYDGSEGWELKICPPIPDYLRKNNNEQ